MELSISKNFSRWWPTKWRNVRYIYSFKFPVHFLIITSLFHLVSNKWGEGGATPWLLILIPNLKFIRYSLSTPNQRILFLERQKIRVIIYIFQLDFLNCSGYSLTKHRQLVISIICFKLWIYFYKILITRFLFSQTEHLTKEQRAGTLSYVLILCLCNSVGLGYIFLESEYFFFSFFFCKITKYF